jgi:hypothetical protein
MSGTQGPIGMGDVFRAIAAVAPRDRDAWPAIAAALGFELPVPVDALGDDAEADRGPDSRMSGPVLKVATGPAVARQEASLPVLAPLEGQPTQRAPFLVGVQTLPAEVQTATAAGPAMLSLLAPSTAPSIVRAMAVMPQPGGPLDLPEVVRGVARRRMSGRLPRRRRLGIAHDVVVLRDLGEGMDLFAEDADLLIEALRRAAGQHAVREGGFIGRPVEALMEIGLARGTAVVVLTDLGLTPIAGPDERGSARWLELAAFTQRVGARATALVPWPESRWPPDLAARLALVTWDRHTRVGQVMRAVRDHG